MRLLIVPIPYDIEVIVDFHMHVCKQTLITLQQINSDFITQIVFVAQKTFSFYGACSLDSPQVSI